MVRVKVGFPPAVKDVIWARARGRCERHGVPLNREAVGTYNVHHRRPRGAGGTSLAWVNQAANGLLLCVACHAWVESRRTAAILAGFLISAIGIATAETTPLRHALYGLVLLKNDGSWERADNEREEVTR